MRRSYETIPPATHTFRPEQREKRETFLDLAGRIISGRSRAYWQGSLPRLWRLVPAVMSREAEVAALSDVEIRTVARQLGLDLRRAGFREDLVAHVFALVREVAGRTLGKKHFPCQLVGGWVMLQGMVAEMETGEGKTLTATLAAATAALAGIPVHVLTVNDYLTARDAEEMGPVYRVLGLSVGCIVHDVPPPQRRREYECDIVYCTNKEITFDYLRDRMVLGSDDNPFRLQAESIFSSARRSERLVMRGLHFAIIDEADSILVDEARTPLIISGGASGAEEEIFFRQAFDFAGELTEGKDYRVDSDQRRIVFADKGRQLLGELAAGRGPLWSGTVRREEAVYQALVARHLFRVNEHYVVVDGKVQIVDEFTGRIMADRSWERGLQQLIEIKEGCEPTRQRETLARISYQRFFRRYLYLAGMTGTAQEIAGEILSVYGVPVVSVPTNRPVRRVACPDRICPTLEEKWDFVLERISLLHDKGRPVLVGTRSVAASEHLSLLLQRADLPHQVLNAKRDKEEAEIVAVAGEPGRITIATNMAGRGTDIKLAPGVEAVGGLHVILTELHEASRIDRQLIGRCGRQGDAGSYEVILSLQDPLLEGGRIGFIGLAAMRLLPKGSRLWSRMARRAVRRAQVAVEGSHARIRSELLKQDAQWGEMLSFSGRIE